MTDRQLFIRQQAREMRQLFCSLCGLEAPRFAGGVCDDCAADSTTAPVAGGVGPERSGGAAWEASWPDPSIDEMCEECARCVRATRAG